MTDPEIIADLYRKLIAAESRVDLLSEQCKVTQTRCDSFLNEIRATFVVIGQASGTHPLNLSVYVKEVIDDK
jgi:hypothetical protein